MRLIRVIVIVLVLAGIAFAGYIQFPREQFIWQCQALQKDQRSLLGALQSNDLTRCAGIAQEKRCIAQITKDPSKCLATDLDCIAIASQNVSMCIEETCRAWASGNTAECSSLGEKADWCVQLTSNNAEARYFKSDRETCSQNAPKGLF